MISHIEEYFELPKLKIKWDKEKREVIKERIEKGIEALEEIKYIEESIRETKNIIQNENENYKRAIKEMEEVEKGTKRDIKQIIYESNKIEYEEIINKIMNKSHLFFIFECELLDYDVDSSDSRDTNGLIKYTMYVEEKINCYDNYISHLNTNSFIIDGYNKEYKSEGTLIGSEENHILLSFKCRGWNKIKVYKEGRIYGDTIKHIKIIEMKRTEKEIEKEKQKEEEENQSTNKIDRYSMMIISKYFNRLNNYINMEKCCKEYRGIIEQYRFNPIPFNSEKERELFKNIETYHFYGKEIEDISEEEMRIITNDERIKKCIHWETVSYSEWKESKREKEEYKNIEYRKENMKKYLFDHDEGKEGKYNYKIYLKTEKVELEEGMTSVGCKCFECCINLKEINIPLSVSEIGEYCFRGCSNLSTIKIPSSVSSIGDFCFFECSNLSEINIPSTISEIGDCCFSLCSNLNSITIPSSVSVIGKGNFWQCSKLSTINISIYVKSIGNDCFEQCTKLSSINIPSNVSSIGKSCFKGCSNLSTINIPSSVSEIGDYCFYECSNLSTINIPSNVSTIGGSCFYDCLNLSSMNIPSSVSYIGYGCFYSCSNLSTINIPSSVSEIGEYCFYGCSKLKRNIRIDPNNPTYRTDGTRIYRKDNNQEVRMW